MPHFTQVDIALLPQAFEQLTLADFTITQGLHVNHAFADDLGRHPGTSG